MYSASPFGINRNISSILAATVVAFGGLVFDRAHLASAPEGAVEIGPLTQVETPAEVASPQRTRG
ncbi:MAG: hypothetical protein ACREEP_09765 [Dongiaceae bacterium]